MSPAPLLIEAGRIHVLGGRSPVAAMLVRGGRVAAIGSAAEVRAAAPVGTRRLRLDGATITPGLTDAHVHLTAWALARARIELGGTRSLDEGLARVRAQLTGRAPGDWVLGRGWDRNRWGGFPDRHALDSVVAERPAFLESHDLHAAWLNTEALRRCGITAATPDPPGGEIVREPGTRDPTGVLLENAKALATAHLPGIGAAALQAALLEAQREAHAFGITAVHSVEPSGLTDFSALERCDRLRLRVLQHLPLADLDPAVALGLRSGWRSPGAGPSVADEEPIDWIRIGGIKIFLDGALGSRTAWMREPYEGPSGGRGIQVLPADVFRETVRRLTAAGFAAAVHAIGDAAVELAVDVLAAHPPPARLPHRIEHLQLCPPDLWARIGHAGIVGSVQPVHLRSDIPAAERHWGRARSQSAYPFAALLRSGVTLAFGSDAPVETIDPRQGLFAAARRVAWDGSPRGGWFAEHRLDAAQALSAYTEGPSLAAGEAARRGRLTSGSDADLVAWDIDPLGCEPDRWLEMRCWLTMVAGEIVHRSPGMDG